MEHYVGLDVSLKLTAICIVDRTGKIEREGVVASDPETIAAFIKSHAPHVARVGLEAGATSTWLWTELNKLGLPVICIDARHAKAALKLQINKSDRNDAVGIARIMQCGWYKEVRVKDLDSHAIKALLVSRALLVKIKRDIENQVRGLLKNLGLVIGQAKMNVFAVRAAELAGARPELAGAVEPLLKAREAVGRQIADLDRKVMRLARNVAQVRQFMTAPGIGPITALCFLATIDDPTRFRRSRSVGAYVGLTTRRYASGETDWTGRISKCGDKMLRTSHAIMQRAGPTAERTLDPARMFAESLTPRPELENSQDPERTCAPARDQLQWRAGCELIILPMLARKNLRGCDAADCGLARKARLIRVRPALCRERYRFHDSG
jgi:transposase